MHVLYLMAPTFLDKMHSGEVKAVLEFKMYLWPSQTCTDFVVSFTLGMCVTLLALSSIIHCHDV